MLVPPEREEILAAADEKVAQLGDDYRDGLITDNERYRQVVQIWQDASDKIQTYQRVRIPTVRSILSPTQGLPRPSSTDPPALRHAWPMADPSGRIMEIPVRGNFRDGLTVMEYFISSHGARKGLADTALRIAESGDLPVA